MAKSTLKNLRNLYGFLLGEDLVKKLSDDQVKLVSSYYESLSDKEKEKINDAISEGKSHDLLEMAQTLLEESKQDKKPEPKTKKTKTRKEPEKNSPGALTKYEGVDEDDFVEEEIDERVLKILGLQDGVGLTYGEYSTLLKEKLTIARGNVSEASTVSREENEIIKNSFDEIREKIRKGKDKSDKFKVKSKKISAEKFIPKGTFEKPKERYLLPGNISKVENQEEDKKDIKSEESSSLLEKVIEIKTSVDNILSLLSKQNSIVKKQSERERLDKGRRSRGKKEESLEKNNKIAKNLVANVIAPVQGILDKIINFFVWVILGRAVTKFFEWARDPKNKEQVEALGNLLKNWWPTILGAFLLFTTPLGKFIRVIVGTVTKLTFQLLRKGIPALRRFLKDRDKKKNKVTSDSNRKKPRGRNNRATQSAGDKLSKPKGRVTGRGGLLGFLALEGLAMATPFLSEKVGEIYSNLKIGDAGLSDEDLLKEYQREKSNIDRRTSGPLGDLMSQRTDYSRLEGLEQELDRRGLSYKFGGPIRSFSGIVTPNDGTKVSGAGSDTQAFAVEGGGTAVLKPGELVLNEQQQKDIQRDTGVDPKSYVAEGRPPQSFGIKRYNTGGIIGNVPQGPHTPLPSPGYVRPEGSFIPRPNLRGMPGPMGKPMPWGFNPFQGLKGGGMIKKPTIPRSPKIDAMRLGASSINISPIDTDLPRPMTGFRDLAEVQYRNELRNNQKVRGLQGGGFIQKLQSLFTGPRAKATASKPRVPSWYGPAPIQDWQTPEAKALLRTIRTAEHYSGRDPYTSIYGGGSAPVTKMTVQEVIDMGNTGKLPQRFGGKSAGYASGSAATGAYQFMPFTLKDLIRKGLAKPNEVMTQKVQDRLGWGLASNRGVTISALKKSGLTQSIMDKMAPEWASFPYSPKGGLSYYDQPVKGADFLNQIYKQSLPKKKQGGGIVGPSWLPWNWGKLVDNQRKSNKGLGYEARYNNVTDPEMRKMLGLSPLKKQGGGEIEALERTYKQGQMSGANSEALKAIGDEAFLLKHFGPGGVWRNFKGSGVTDYRGNIIPKKAGGGKVKENTGIDIRGATADRQLTALHPGEYVLPVDVVNSIGIPSLDKLVSDFDSNSNPAKIVKNVNKSIPGPRNSKSNGPKVLPPIQQQIGNKGMPMETNGSEVPPFSVISPYSKRSNQMSIYGII